MSQNYKMIIQYEGTRYDGWQKQGNTENTIQGRLEKVLERMAGCPVEVHGSGRTDAGVHAMGQVANFHLPDGCRPDAEWIRTYLNQYLPDDIAITELIMVPERFHSRLSAVKKIYTYQIETGTKKNVFSRRTCYGLGQALDITAMQKAAELLCGTHDYKSFCGNKKMKKSTVRTIYRIAVEQQPGEAGVRGNGLFTEYGTDPGRYADRGGDRKAGAGQYAGDSCCIGPSGSRLHGTGRRTLSAAGIL